MIDEAAEVEHFQHYWQTHRGTMDALAVQATWLALKGACTLQETRHGVRIQGVTALYPTYNTILQKHIEKYRLSKDERAERMTSLAKYAKLHLGR